MRALLRCRTSERAKLVCIEMLIAIICTNLVNFGNTFLFRARIFFAQAARRALCARASRALQDGSRRSYKAAIAGRGNAAPSAAFNSTATTGRRLMRARVVSPQRASSEKSARHTIA